MEAEIHTGLSAALTIAYNAVISLGYTHQQLVGKNPSVNYNTLRRIRDGKTGKTSTDMFFLRLFVAILEKEYQKRLTYADSAGTRSLLRTMKDILLAEIEVSV